MGSPAPGKIVQVSELPQRLPHDPEAERAVLGAVLLEPVALLGVVDKLREDELYLESIGHNVQDQGRRDEDGNY